MFSRNSACAVLLLVVCSCQSSDADVFRWDDNRRIFGTQGIELEPGVILESLDLSFADLNEKNLSGSSFASSNLTSAQAISSDFTAANLGNADLSSAYFVDANLTNADLSGANLTFTYFSPEFGRPAANLQGANLSGANLTDTVFYSVSLVDANFQGAVIDGTRFSDATQRGFTYEQLASTASYLAGSLPRIDLSRSDLSNWDLHGLDLNRASFTNAILDGADLQDANLFQVSLSHASLMNANLSGANVRRSNLISAQFIRTNLSQANLAGADFTSASLDGADLSGADLTGAKFEGATLDGALFSDARITGASLREVVGQGFTHEQLASTASFQEKNLREVSFRGNDLTGWSFRGQDLTDATFLFATLTGADFTDSVIQGVDFTGAVSRGLAIDDIVVSKSYQIRDLRRVRLGNNDLSGMDLSGQDLTGAELGGNLLGVNLAGANLTGALIGPASWAGIDLTNANINRASLASQFDINDLTEEQIASTLSYQRHDLAGILCAGCNFDGWDLTGQSLINVVTILTSTVGTDFTGADLRGSSWIDLESGELFPRGANLRNSIGPFGELSGLELVSGERVVVRPYKDTSGDAESYIIWASQSFTVSEGGTVELRFDHESWGSTILFEPGTPVEIHGTLELRFAEGTDVRSQVGRTFEIFQWNDVVPLGEFQVTSPYQWDLSDLYSAGQITLVGVPEPAGYGGIIGSLLWWMTVYRRWLVNRPTGLLRR